MNISGLGSLSWYTGTRSITSTDRQAGDSTSSTDTASISSGGFAALLESQGGGRPPPPPMTDDQASAIGQTLQKKNADLFSALDTDSDGTLTATELKAGMDALRGSQGSSGASGPPPKPDNLTDGQAATIGTSLQQDDAALFTALDTDSDGTLSVQELTSAQKAMHQAMEANGMKPPPPPDVTTGSTWNQQDGQPSDDTLSQLLGSSSTSSWSDLNTNLMSDLLQNLFATNKS